MYHHTFEDNWKTQEGGILYCIGLYREFFNCMLNYHSPAKTTGSKEWDDLFHELKTTGYPKKIIPCMFFGREAGCTHNSCPFLHDKRAVQENRAMVITKRRETFDGKPSPRQKMDRRRLLLDLKAVNDYNLRQTISTSGKLEKAIEGDKGYCANLECLKPWKEHEETCPFQRCQQCKLTFYCSRDCQKKDWKRHKKEPCAPVEELIENDNIWSPTGVRKGTEMIQVDWGEA